MAHPMVVTVVCDGNRPDFVRDDTMPTVAALRRAGVWFADQRGIFPSATRASSASIATGSLPISHGLRGNSVGLPIPGGHAFHDVGKPEFFETYRAHFGRMLTRPAIAERVAGHGGAILVSNVSPGAAWFHDSRGHGHLWNRAGSFGPGRVPLAPIDSPPGLEGDRVSTARFIAELAERRPAVATLWLSEPDKTMHAVPLGSPGHLAVLREVDARVAEVAEAVERLRDQGHDVLFLVASDHGHQAVIEVIPVERRLFEAGFKATLEGPELIVAPQGSAAFVYLAGEPLARRDEIMRWLAGQTWVGGVIAGEDLAQLGQIPSLDVLAIDMAKSEGVNSHGVPGLTAMAVRFSQSEDDIRRDCGMHGGLGRQETNPMLIAVGRGFSAGATVAERTSITDLTPTALRHLDLPETGMDGTALQDRHAA